MSGRHAAPSSPPRGAAPRPGDDGRRTRDVAGDDSRVVRPVAADQATYVRVGRTILDSVSVTAAPGESLAVVGPSGSGKSSLLALLADLQPPDHGTVTGQDQRLGLVLQGYGLVSVLTAAENVEVALQAGVLGALSPDEITRRSGEAIRAVGLDHVADHLIEELSGGQQQRVAIARALAVDPDVLLADELTAELDRDWKDHVVDLVLGVAHRGGVVVIATHDPELADRCDRIVRLVDGRVVPS